MNNEQEEQEQEEEKGKDLARELAKEKAKEALKKVAKEAVKKAAKKAAVVAAKKIGLAAGKAIAAVLVKTAPIWGTILLIILVIVIIISIIPRLPATENRCDEIIWLRENDPDAYQEFKKIAEENKYDWTGCTEERYMKETKSIRPEPTMSEVKQTETTRPEE